jgi:hypothetical protein
MFSRPRAHNWVSRTPRISCEAVPPSILPAGAQGGTSACRTGAALSFVSCIRLFGGLAPRFCRAGQRTSMLTTNAGFAGSPSKSPVCGIVTSARPGATASNR